MSPHPFDGSYARWDCHTCALDYPTGDHYPAEHPHNVFADPEQLEGEPEHASPKLEAVADQPRRYTREHDYVSTACQHRLHERCRQRCKYCDTRCLCVCHRWAVPV